MPTRLPMTELDVRSIARTYTRSMIAVLVSVARQKSAQPGARVAAASVILDRGWGKVKEHVESGEGDIKITIRHILEHIDERPVVVNGESVRCIDEDTTSVDASPVLPNDDDVK